MAIRCALRLRGGTFIDTEDAYGYGHSEQILGRALADGLCRRGEATMAVPDRAALTWLLLGSHHRARQAARAARAGRLSGRSVPCVWPYNGGGAMAAPAPSTRTPGRSRCVHASQEGG